jgi:uncharacterized protein
LREYKSEELTSLFNYLVEEQVLIKDQEGLKEPNETEIPVKKERASLTAMVLNISQKCNMKCTYCYADGGTYNSPEQMMNEKTAEASVKFLLETSDAKTC